MIKIILSETNKLNNFYILQKKIKSQLLEQVKNLSIPIPHRSSTEDETKILRY